MAGKESFPKQIDYSDEVVFIRSGRFKGRIGFCDGEADNPFQILVCFGEYLLRCHLYDIHRRNVRRCTMNDLITRLNDIQTAVMRSNWVPDTFEPLSEDEEVDLMHELVLITSEITHRDKVARLGMAKQGKRLYLAHSSADKGYVRRIHADLKHLGHDPWLDEFEIKVGESIVSKIETGIASADYLILFMSPNAQVSEWVKTEWETKFWDEIGSKSVKILPALIRDCEIPVLLRRKKYADFRESYEHGLEQLLRAIGHHE